MASDNSTIQVTDQVENLPSKPLVEAIFELHWQLKNPMPGPFVESEYQLLFARLLSDLHDRYPDYQSLEIAKAGVHFPWVVEHQFRGVGGWPIVQLGPGIIAFNETESYKWVNFESEVSRVVGTIFKIWNGHPPGLKTAVLRYIDAIELKDSESDILQ